MTLSPAGVGRGGVRAGAGRKPKLGPDPTQITLRIGEALVERATALAESRGIEFSELVRRALAGYCTELEARDRRNGG